MEKIAAKQIDGVVDLVTEQQVTARKQFNGGVGASNGTSTHYPILKGGYLYWVVSPGGFPQEGDYRLGVGSNGRDPLQWYNRRVFKPAQTVGTHAFAVTADGALKMLVGLRPLHQSIDSQVTARKTRRATQCTPPLLGCCAVCSVDLPELADVLLFPFPLARSTRLSLARSSSWHLQPQTPL